MVWGTTIALCQSGDQGTITGKDDGSGNRMELRGKRRMQYGKFGVDIWVRIFMCEREE